MEKYQTANIGMGYFNLAKGLGMILIVLGHSANLLMSGAGEPGGPVGAGSVVGGGIVAAFFMMSGYGFFKRSPKKCWRIQTKLLLRPYYIVAAAVLMTRLLLAMVKERSFWGHGGELVLTYLFGLNAEGGGHFMGIPIESVSIFWFVLALFGGWNLYNAISRLKSVWLRRGLVTACVILSYLMTLLSKVWIFCLPMALLAAGYLAAGDWMRKSGWLERPMTMGWRVLLTAGAAVSLLYGQVNIVAGVWKLGLVDVAGSFCVGMLMLKLYGQVMKREPSGKVIGLIEEIGLNSIWVVCLHGYEKVIFPWHRLAAVWIDQPVLGTLICFAGRCAVMYGIYKAVCFLRRRCRRKKRIRLTLD